MTGISKQIWDHAKAIGVEEGKAIGVEEGQTKARAAAVLALLRDGRLTPESISDILGLPLDYVLSLSKTIGA